jgi:hypothetical protein
MFREWNERTGGVEERTRNTATVKQNWQGIPECEIQMGNWFDSEHCLHDTTSHFAPSKFEKVTWKVWSKDAFWSSTFDRRTSQLFNFHVSVASSTCWYLTHLRATSEEDRFARLWGVWWSRRMCNPRTGTPHGSWSAGWARKRRRTRNAVPQLQRKVKSQVQETENKVIELVQYYSIKAEIEAKSFNADSLRVRASAWSGQPRPVNLMSSLKNSCADRSLNSSDETQQKRILKSNLQ